LGGGKEYGDLEEGGCGILSGERRLKLVKLGWIVCLCVVASWSLVHAQGYRMESDRIVVEGDHWKAWDQPKGVLKWDGEGGLRPRFVPKEINASLDADRFTYRVAPGSIERMRGGPRDAGSNPNDVANVMDGDLSTFWEPDREDPLENWWFVIDLGRLVQSQQTLFDFRADPSPRLCFSSKVLGDSLVEPKPKKVP